MKGITLNYRGFAKDVLSAEQLLSLFDKLWGETNRCLHGYPKVIGVFSAHWRDGDGKEHHVAHINELIDAYNKELTYDINILGSIDKKFWCKLIYIPAHKKALFQVYAPDEITAQQYISYVKDMFPMKHIPLILISYADDEIALADFVKKILQRFMGNQTEIFVAKRDISSGKDWLEVMKNKLKTAYAVIPICSNKAKQSSWVWWESAAIWAITNRIHPLFTNISANNFGPPLSLFTQGKSYFDKEEFIDTLKSICKDFSINIDLIDFLPKEIEEYNRLKAQHHI